MPNLKNIEKINKLNIHSVINSLAEAILIVSLEGEVIGFNTEFVKLWSIPDELANEHDDNKLLQSVLNQLLDPNEFLQSVQKLYSEPKKHSHDEVQFKDGRIIERYSAPYIIEGEIIGRSWSFRNITNQKLDERRRLENAGRFEALFNSSDVGVFTMVDYFEDCNEKVCEIFECKKEDIIGCEPWEFSPETQPDGRSSIDAAGEKIKAALNGDLQKFYWQHKTFKGRLIDTEVRLKKIILNDKPYIQAIVRDITEERKNKKIKEAIFKISESVNTAEDMDTMYSRIHEIVSSLMPANNFYLALYDEEDNLLSFPYFRDEYDDAPAPQKPGRGLTDYVLRTGEDLLVDAAKDLELRKSGEVDLIGQPQAIWLGIALKIEGKTMGVMVLQDYENPYAYGEPEKQLLIFVSEQIAIAIDRKKKIENLKILTEEYRYLNATKDKFLSIIAHDLKNPFSTLLGFSDMLEEDYYEMDDEERLQYVGFIKKSASGTLSLLENLLQWSRSQMGKISYNPENIDLSTFVVETVELIKRTASLKGVTLINHISSPQIVFADKFMLETVIRNLLNNSVKFTSHGNSIELKSVVNDSRYEVSIIDTGVGMSEKVKDSLFKIDKSVSTNGTNGETGTGLGLILCQEFVRKNGGDIWVESEEGRGSKFTFTLPRPHIK